MPLPVSKCIIVVRLWPLVTENTRRQCWTTSSSKPCNVVDDLVVNQSAKVSYYTETSSWSGGGGASKISDKDMVYAATSRGNFSEKTVLRLVEYSYFFVDAQRILRIIAVLLFVISTASMSPYMVYPVFRMVPYACDDVVKVSYGGGSDADKRELPVL